MDHDKFIRKAKESVAEASSVNLTADAVYVVWFCKVLGNWKALISTDVVNGLYWEVTHNGATSETYVDEYHKFSNNTVKESEPN